jgi:NAD(P)-dependent dehydrogenase (short-subunit alcohol dehydrogenase family)
MTMAETFAGKAALVTGASSGIGRAVARRLAAEGAAVGLVARRGAVLAEVADEIERGGGRAVALPANVCEVAAIQRAVDGAVQAFGRLDVLVCAAARSTAGRLRDVPDEIVAEAVQTKLLGYVRFAREAAEHLPAGGAIVLVVGGAGKHPNPTNVVNALSNAALLAFTQAFAEDLAPRGVRVVAVNPGPVATPVLDRYLAVRVEREGISREEALERHRREQPLGRIPTPEDVADLVAFLASDAAGLISGTSVDFGGRGRAL